MKKPGIMIILWTVTWFTVTGCLETRSSGGNGKQNSQFTASSCQVPQTEDLETLVKDWLPDLKKRGICSQEEDSIERKVSELVVVKAKRLLQADQDDEAEQLLRYPYTPFKSWEAQATLGEIAWRRRNWQDAFVYLESAWDLLNDPGATPISPSPAEKQKVADLAMEVQLMEGSLKRVIRGDPTEEITAVPVQFVFGKDTFTQRGKASVETLKEYFKGRHPEHITLMGHTDPIDTDSYNCRLSKRRAEAVKKELIAAGFNANQITVIAKGERDPPTLSRGNKYTKEEIYQLDRRVTFSEEEMSDSKACN